jgi:hypothetical protein
MCNTKHVWSSDLCSEDAQFKSQAEHNHPSYIFSVVSNEIMTAFFNILSNPIFTIHPIIQCYIVPVTKGITKYTINKYACTTHRPTIVTPRYTACHESIQIE